MSVLGGSRVDTPQLAVIGAVVLSANVAGHLGLAQELRGIQRRSACWFLQILGDLAALTAALYVWGGVEDPLVLLYPYYAICGVFLLSKRSLYAVSGSAVALLGLAGAIHAGEPSLFGPFAMGVGATTFTDGLS